MRKRKQALGVIPLESVVRVTYEHPALSKISNTHFCFVLETTSRLYPLASTGDAVVVFKPSSFAIDYFIVTDWFALLQSGLRVVSSKPQRIEYTPAAPLLCVLRHLAHVSKV